MRLISETSAPIMIRRPGALEEIPLLPEAQTPSVLLELTKPKPFPKSPYTAQLLQGDASVGDSAAQEQSVAPFSHLYDVNVPLANVNFSNFDTDNVEPVQLRSLGLQTPAGSTPPLMTGPEQVVPVNIVNRA